MQVTSYKLSGIFWYFVNIYSFRIFESITVEARTPLKSVVAVFVNFTVLAYGCIDSNFIPWKDKQFFHTTVLKLWLNIPPNRKRWRGESSLLAQVRFQNIFPFSAQLTKIWVLVSLKYIGNYKVWSFSVILLLHSKKYTLHLFSI